MLSLLDNELCKFARTRSSRRSVNSSMQVNLSVGAYRTEDACRWFGLERGPQRDADCSASSLQPQDIQGQGEAGYLASGLQLDEEARMQ